MRRQTVVEGKELTHIRRRWRVATFSRVKSAGGICLWLKPHLQPAGKPVLLQARAEPAVVIDEDLRVGRKLESQARAHERGVAAEVDAGFRERASRHADERGAELCQASRNSWLQPRRNLGRERAGELANAMCEVRRTPSVVAKELPSALFTESAPKPPVSLKPSIGHARSRAPRRADAHIDAASRQPPMVAGRQARRSFGPRAGMSRRRERPRAGAAGREVVKLRPRRPSATTGRRPAGVSRALVGDRLGARAAGSSPPTPHRSPTTPRRCRDRSASSPPIKGAAT